MINFEHPEDQWFFESLLCGPGEDLVAYSYLFDFRPPTEKRAEFNGRMRALKTQLVARFGQVCQLRLLEECDPGAGLAIDHVIPLSTNKLNKELRNLVAAKGRKVATQSFGSNNIQNLVFACGRCNGYKKHRFLTREQLKRALSVHKAV